jgi:hypothetical protein
MKRENLNPLSSLNIEERLKLAQKEIVTGLKEWLEQDRLRRLKTWEAAKKIVLG